MSELPSGTVTFLFTDIERSTASAAALGDERWADVLADHRRLLREAFGKSGHEVATEGDSFFVAFERAQGAVTAAAHSQRTLGAHLWPGESALRVRMGIHTGEALVRDGAYVGHEVHRAKRICDAAHGGQILLSRTTADLLGSSHSLIDLGLHRLKDLGEPQRIYQLADEGLERDFPPVRSLDAFRHSLPLQRSAFIGREKEIVQIRELLETNRIVTLTGFGGCGKTRLALQVAAEELDRFPGGVFFVNLAPISDPDAVVREVATSVGVAMGGIAAVGAAAGPADQVLLSHLAGGTSLVLLDNCEHLVDACAAIADRILARCPDMTILATSREGLRVEGEQLWVVRPLSVPGETGDAQASESVSLFRARAKAVRPGFDLVPDNIDAVVEICRRLDGIPLAIEFAAARVSHLSPRQIADRLDDRFKLLTGGQRRVQRQHTLRAALDWSFDLLDEHEQVLLRRLSVFAGDLGIEAAEGICTDEKIGAGPITDLLGSLVSKSLVETELVGDEVRYKLLETVRAYAAERLAHAEESTALRRRHCDWYLAWIESIPLEEVVFVVGMRISREEPNLLTALEWAAADNRPDIIGRIAGRLFFRSWPEDTKTRWIRSGLEAEAQLPADDVLLLQLHGVDGTTIAINETALEDASPEVRCLALSARGFQRAVIAAFARNGDLAADAYRDLDEALRLAKDVRGEWAANCLWERSRVDLVSGHIREAMYAGEESVRRYEAAGNTFMAVWMNFYLAPVALVCGDLDRAARAWAVYVRRLREVIREDDWSAFPLGVCTIFAALTANFESPDSAWPFLAAMRPRVLRSSLQSHADDLILACAAVRAAERDFASAAVLLSWVRAHAFDVGRPLGTLRAFPHRHALYLHYRNVLREALAPDEAKRARELGSKMSLDEALGLAFEDRIGT